MTVIRGLRNATLIVIEITWDTNIRDDLPYVRITDVEINTRIKATQRRGTMRTDARLANKSWGGRLIKVLIAGLSFVCAPAISNAAELKERTVKAWNEYIRAANSRMQERLRLDNHFLWIDEAPDRSRRARVGEILVSEVGARNPKRVPSGLIHHWIGAAFLQNTTLDEVFAVVRDYSRYKEFYKPTVIDSKPVSQVGTQDKFSMLLLNKALLKRIALESDYESSYVQIDSRRWYSLASATRVQEIDDYGQPGERKLPPDEGRGYIWRLYSVSRFEERDGGVYVELEAIALSRDIPVSFRWIVDPVVRRVSRDSLSTSLRQTSDAVRSMSNTASLGMKSSTHYVISSGSATKRPPQDTAVRQTWEPLQLK
jgi:hypothetical protein